MGLALSKNILFYEIPARFVPNCLLRVKFFLRQFGLFLILWGIHGKEFFLEYTFGDLSTANLIKICKIFRHLNFYNFLKLPVFRYLWGDLRTVGFFCSILKRA
jgi:hypothetical protein